MAGWDVRKERLASTFIIRADLPKGGGLGKTNRPLLPSYSTAISCPANHRICLHKKK
jgi:hypothetical protein